ncbi:MAG: hypothetical protein JW829_05720 [Pirellulales bacterium]|nr:hypothetical protein [Pirellulales bacterium]
MIIRLDKILWKFFTVIAALSLMVLVGCPTYVDVTPPDQVKEESLKDQGPPESKESAPQMELPSPPEGDSSGEAVPPAGDGGNEARGTGLSDRIGPYGISNPSAWSPNPRGTMLDSPADLPDQPREMPDQHAILWDNPEAATVERAASVDPSQVENENPLRRQSANQPSGSMNRLRDPQGKEFPEELGPVSAIPLPAPISAMPLPDKEVSHTTGSDGLVPEAMDATNTSDSTSGNESGTISIPQRVQSSRIAASSKTSSAVDQAKINEMIQRNGPIFVGWNKPKVAFLFTGELNGYIEPCGCAGLDNQKGGLSRRFSLIKQLRAEGWPVVLLDVGGQVKRFGPQAEIKFRHIIESFVTLGYHAVSLGPNDLRLEVLPLAAELENKNPFLSANVALGGFDSGFTRRFTVLEAGGYRIGVTAVLGDEHHKGLTNSIDVQAVHMVSAIEEIVPQMHSANCDICILLAHASPDQSTALAKRFPVFDFVVTAGGFDEPPTEMTHVEGTKTRLIEVGQKGMYVSVVGIFDDPQMPVRYNRVPLDARFPGTQEMLAMMVKYQKDLQTLGLDGLQVKPAPRGDGGRFAGTSTCVDCHMEAAEVFEQTTHAHAFDTLVNLDPPRTHDPECISCHVTGWNFQKYFPYTTGYLSQEKTPQMLHNGCENCHGPGLDHVTAENRANELSATVLERYRAALRLKIAENEGNKPGQKTDGAVVRMCIECHDQDNSPEFDFQEYWTDVEHQGKE